MSDSINHGVDIVIPVEGYLGTKLNPIWTVRPEAGREFVAAVNAHENGDPSKFFEKVVLQLRESTSIRVSLIINSLGGSAQIAENMLKLFEKLGREKILAYVPFLAASAAADLFLSAGTRVIAPQALIGIHTKSFVSRSDMPSTLSSDPQEAIGALAGITSTVRPEYYDEYRREVSELAQNATPRGREWLEKKLENAGKPSALLKDPTMSIDIPGTIFPLIDPTAVVKAPHDMKTHMEPFVRQDKEVAAAWKRILKAGQPR